MSKNTNATFVRRKFTITEGLDTELERMAADNYQGNVSLCLRQAIVDHRETLQGNGDLTLRRLVESNEQVKTQIAELSEAVDTVCEQTDASADSGDPLTGVTASSDDASNAKGVITTLETASSPLRIEDIIEQVHMQPVEVRSALGYLLDQGYVFTTEGTPPRYHLASMNTSSVIQYAEGDD